MKFCTTAKLAIISACIAVSCISALNRPSAYTDIFLKNNTQSTISIKNSYTGPIDAQDRSTAFQVLTTTVPAGQRAHILRVARGGISLNKAASYSFTSNVTSSHHLARFTLGFKTTNVAGPGKTSYAACVQIIASSGQTPCVPDDNLSKQTANKIAVGDKIYVASLQWLGLNDSLYHDVEYEINQTGVATDPKKLTLLQYNIQQRPSSEGTHFEVTGQHNERSYLSTVVIPQAIKPFNADVVTFNEAFTARLRPELIANMAKVGYMHYTDAVGATSKAGFWSGGVMVFSKHPIVKKAEYIYKNTASSDSSANKGVWYVQINKGGKLYNIFATHTNASYSDFVNNRLRNDDAGKKARKEQFKELRTFIDQQNIPAHQPVIIVGDLNADMLSEKGQPDDEYDYILKTLDVTLPNIIYGHHYTYDIKTNPLVDAGMQQQWLDFALYSNRHQKPVNSAVKAFALKAPAGTIWGSSKLVGKDLSDHYPLVANFEFPK